MYCTSLQGNTYVMNHFHLNKENTFIYLIMFNWKSQLKNSAALPLFHMLSSVQKLLLSYRILFSQHTATKRSKKVIPSPQKKADPSAYSVIHTLINLFENLKLTFKVIHMWIKNIRFILG